MLDVLLAAALPLLSGPILGVQPQMRYTAEQSATVAAEGAARLEVLGRAGSLTIEGRDGIREVRVRATARASDRDDLDDIRLIAERVGDVVRVEAELPEDDRDWDEDRQMALDLVLEVPASLPVEADDGSGSIDVRGVRALVLDDGSGEIDIVDVAGPVRIEDGSGSVRLERIRGDVWVDDGSGELEIRDVQGSVVISDDGSGNIDIAEVTGDVTIRDDASGGIDVDRVGGSFTVERDGSGGIRYQAVEGTVRIPEEKHGRRRHRDWR